MSKIRKAVIPAAGFGTRFLPQTKAMPKEMLPIVDKPVIQIVVEELVAAGIEDIIIVTGYHKRGLEDHFDAPNKELIANLKMGGEKKAPMLKEVEEISNLANFAYVRQKGPYGNGTPLVNVKHLIGNEPFIYTWADDFMAADVSMTKQLIETYEKYNCSVQASLRVTKDEDYDRYGVAAGEEIESGVLNTKVIVEKPGKENAPSDYATMSGYLFTPDIFEYLDAVLENLPAGDEFYFNDALKLMLKDGKQILTKEIVGGKYYDTGNKFEYMKTVIEFALKHPELKDDLREYLKNLDL